MGLGLRATPEYYFQKFSVLVNWNRSTGEALITRTNEFSSNHQDLTEWRLSEIIRQAVKEDGQDFDRWEDHYRRAVLVSDLDPRAIKDWLEISDQLAKAGR